MSANFLSKLRSRKGDGAPPSKRASFSVAIVLVLWTLVGFGAAQVLLVASLYVLKFFGVSFVNLDQTVFTAVSAVLVYCLTLVILIGLPWVAKKYRTSQKDMGMTRPVSWTDIGLAPVGCVIYFLASAMLVYAFTVLAPGIDLTQAQDTGFSGISQYYQYLLVFVALVVVAPVAEEMIFRGYLYGKLRKFVPVWVAMLVTSVVFGVVHGQWNVAIDVFALSMVACSLREITGNIWAGTLLHMLKNSVAYYVLFINPALLHTIGG